MFLYELRKVAVTRWLVILLILLFAGNLTVCMTFDEYTARDRAADKEAARLLALHRTDSAEYENTLREMRDACQNKLYEFLEYSQIAAAEGLPAKSLDDEEFQSHIFCDEISDMLLISATHAVDENRKEYERGLRSILQQAKNNAKELRDRYGLGIDNYAYRYQAYVYNVYAALEKQADVGSDLVFGWDKLFSYSYGDMFLFASLLFLSCAVFLFDRPCAMTPLLRCTKHGRGCTFAAKYTLVSLFAVLTVLLYEASVFSVLFFRTGFSVLFTAVQNIAELRFFPYPFSILQYLLLYMLLKVAAALCFTSLCAFFSTLARSALPSVLAGGSLVGSSFLLSTLDRGNHPLLSRMNLFSISAAIPVTDRLYAVGVFGRPVSCIFFAVILLLIFTIAATVVSAFLWSSRREGAGRASALSVRWRVWIKNTLVLRPVKRNGKTEYHSIGIWELRKLLFGNKHVSALILLLALYFVLSLTIQSATYRQSRTNLIYTALYLPELYGSYIEKNESVEKVIAFYKDTDRSLREVEERLERQEITAENAALISGHLRDVRDDTGEAEADIREQTALFEEYVDAGIDAHYIDYRGWRVLFGEGFCIPLFLAILLLAVRAFSMEYLGKSRQNRFVYLQRSAKYGRSTTFRCKMFSLCSVTLVCALFFEGVRLIAHEAVYGFHDLNAPVQSTLVFGEFTARWSICGYLFFLVLAHLTAALLAALLFASISVLCKNVFASLALCLSVTMIPSLLSAAGFGGAKYLSFADWFSVGGMMQTSSDADLFSSDFGVWIAYTAAFSLLTLVLLLCARKKFVK